MASGPPPATAYHPDMEPRFRALADQSPPLKKKEVLQELAKNPPIDPRVYSIWLGKYATDQAKKRLSQAPMTSNAMRSLLQKTNYADPQSMAELALKLGSPSGIERISLGYYELDGDLLSTRQPSKAGSSRSHKGSPSENYHTSSQSESSLISSPTSSQRILRDPTTLESGSLRRMYCFLQPQMGVLPRDFDASPARGDAVVLQVMAAHPIENLRRLGYIDDPDYYPDSNYPYPADILALVLEIGNLCVGEEPEARSATKTPFVMVVAARTRNVYAFWNPLGLDPLSLSDSDPWSRPEAGFLAGTQQKFTALRFNASIEDLVATETGRLSLEKCNIDQFNPLHFGGVDEEGWKILDTMSKEFAAVPHYKT